MKDVFNYMELLVKEKLDKLLIENNVEISEKHKNAVMAFALNNLKPYYISTDIEKITAKLTFTDKQYDTDITTELTKAIERTLLN